MKKKKNLIKYKGTGIMNLDEMEEYKEKGFVLGRNARFWMDIDGVKFLYKEYPDVLSAFGEVLYSKIGKDCGVDCAKYEFAEYKGKIGTISHDFLKGKAYYNCLELTANFGNTEFSLEDISGQSELLIMHNNKYNNMVSIRDLLGQLFHASEEEKEKIEEGLIKMFCLDTVFLHTDRNLWNYGIMVDEINDKMQLAPIHDNSSVLCLELGAKHIEEKIVGLISGKRGIGFGDNANPFNILFEDDDSIEQLQNFYSRCGEKNRKIILDVVSSVNVDSNVEQVNKVCEIGEVSLLWIKAVLNCRRKTILSSLKSAKIYDDELKETNVTFSKRK